MTEHFHELLLDHIRNGRNDEANAMLTKELAQAFDDSAFNGTLLNHAAENNNAVIARRLIELGADVDRFGGHSSTPLAQAMAYPNTAVVQVLLEAGARIDIVDDDGSSALQLCLDFIHVDTEAFELLVKKLRSEASTNEAVAEMLIRAGCNMCHAATLRDVEVMECMLQRGIDVSSRDPTKITAMHVAVELNDVDMADWLMEKGIDVDAIDEDGSSALVKAVERRNITMVEFLLEHGACPDIKGEGHDYTPLYAAFLHLDEGPVDYGPDELVECAELLLQYGASFRNSEDLAQMFQYALNCSCDEAAKLLMARLAMLEKLGKTVDKSAMRSVNECYPTKMSELQKYYELCQQILAVNVFENTLLIDFLNESDHKIKLLARKETFDQEIEKIESKLSELYPFYYNSMMRRVEKAKRVVKLEDEATLVICKIFEATYNQFYHFARGIVEYLNERDLEHLVQV